MAIHVKETAIKSSETPSIIPVLSLKEEVVVKPDCVQESSPGRPLQQETMIQSGFCDFSFCPSSSHYTQQARQSGETQETEKSQSNVPDDDFFLRSFHPVPDDDFFLHPFHHDPDDDIFLRPFHHVPDDDIFLHPFHLVPDDDIFLHPFHHDDDSNLIPLHASKSEDHGMPGAAEKSQSNVPDDDSNLIPNHPLDGAPDKAEERRASFNSLAYRMAVLGLSLLMFTAGMCPVSGTMCDEQAMAVSKGDSVAITCPLTADVTQTELSVVIKYFKPSTYPEDVLKCDLQPPKPEIHCSQTRFRTELIAVQPDRVLARMPKDRLENGTYRCQLVSSREILVTDCNICDPDDAEDVPTTEAPETLPTTLDHRELGGMKKKPSARSDEPKSQISDHGEGGQDGGLVAAVVILSIIVFCLLLLMAAMVVFFLRYSGMIPGRNKTEERKPEEANGFIA